MSSPVRALELDLLLDTHIIIWLATDPDKIPVYLLEMIEIASHRFVSHISALEIQIKHHRSPDQFGFSLEHYSASMKEFAMEELPLTYADIRALDSMQFLHRDPFDRILMTQAASRKLRLVTQDTQIIATGKAFKAFELLSTID